jgi:hypothetical protein
MVLIGSSGEGGAKLHRRNFGEAVESLTGSGEYHWMAGNFLKYGAAEATFEIIGDSFIECRTGPGFGTPLLECANPGWHGRSGDDRAHGNVTQNKTNTGNCYGEVERQFGSPERQHNEHITIVVARGNDKTNGDGK